jgi:hypothetical protein
MHVIDSYKMFFNIVIVLCNALLHLSTSFYIPVEKSFWLLSKPAVNRLLHLVVAVKSSSSQCFLKRAEHMIVGWSEVWNVREWFIVANFSFWIVVAVCGRPLSWRRRTPSESSPRRRLRIAGFSFSSSMVLYLTLFTVVEACHPCGGGVEYLHRGPASRRRRRKGSLRSETVKHNREPQGTGARESLRWWGPAEIVNDRPLLSSDRKSASHQETRNCLTVIKTWPRPQMGVLFQDRLADWP